MMYQVSSIGITAGAHRLWSHRAYKAKWPLRVILIIFNTIAFQVFLIFIIIMTEQIVYYIILSFTFLDNQMNIVLPVTKLKIPSGILQILYYK